MTPPTPAVVDPVRQLRILGMAFFGSAVAILVVLLILAGGWDDPDDGLARTGSWLAAIVGIAGLAAAIWWRNRAVSAPIAPQRLTTSWFAVVAVAELGMIVGFVFTLLSRSLTPFVVGGGVFVLALVIVTAALGQIDVEAEPPRLG